MQLLPVAAICCARCRLEFLVRGRGTSRIAKIDYSAPPKSACLLAVESSRSKAKEEAGIVRREDAREISLRRRRLRNSHRRNAILIDVSYINRKVSSSSIESYERRHVAAKVSSLQRRRIARFISREVVTFLINEPYDTYDRQKEPFACAYDQERF